MSQANHEVIFKIPRQVYEGERQRERERARFMHLVHDK